MWWPYLSNKIKDHFSKYFFFHFFEAIKQKQQDFPTALMKTELHFVELKIGGAEFPFLSGIWTGLCRAPFLAHKPHSEINILEGVSSTG